MENSVTNAEENSSKPVILFGKDLRKVECLRPSFLYGISGGIASGLVSFLLTSHPKNSMHVAMGTYVVTTMCYWGFCRYENAKLRKNIRLYEDTVKSAAILEGTKDGIVLPLDKELESV